jgi:hypoxanthine phosphoribosyltransferase
LSGKADAAVSAAGSAASRRRGRRVPHVLRVFVVDDMTDSGNVIATFGPYAAK